MKDFTVNCRELLIELFDKHRNGKKNTKNVIYFGY